jgi:Purine catabolism regulatory protein-like family/PucR C-terminal helix-turn-helix domain
VRSAQLARAPFRLPLLSRPTNRTRSESGLLGSARPTKRQERDSPMWGTRPHRIAPWTVRPRLRTPSFVRSCIALSITLTELLAIPHLGLTVLAGDDHLSRTVTWAHVSEMEDPTPFLEGGELLMAVGVGFPSDAEAQHAYLERLANRGLVALALADRVTPRLSDDFLHTANELGFPVFEVSWEVPFSELARTVVAANEQSSQRRLMTHIHIFDSLRARVVDGLTPAQLFARIEDLSGYNLYLATPGHEQLLEGVPVPPEEITSSLPTPVERALSVGDARVLPVIVRGDLVGYVVAVERVGATPAGIVAIQHIETVAALEVEQMLSERRLAQTFRAALLEDMLDGHLAPDGIRRRLAGEGFDNSEMLILIVPRRRDELDPAPLLAKLSESLRRRRIPHLLTAELIAGASRPFAMPDGLVLARRDAQLALEIAQLRGSDLIRAGTDVEYPLSLAADRESLERLINSALGALLEYDEVHQTDLVRSLRCYLERERSLREAAACLFVHPNSLAYRLRRIEEITGRRLASIETQTELWTALEAQRILAL